MSTFLPKLAAIIESSSKKLYIWCRSTVMWSGLMGKSTICSSRRWSYDWCYWAWACPTDTRYQPIYARLTVSIGTSSEIPAWVDPLLALPGEQLPVFWADFLYFAWVLQKKSTATLSVWIFRIDYRLSFWRCSWFDKGYCSLVQNASSQTQTLSEVYSSLVICRLFHSWV